MTVFLVTLGSISNCDCALHVRYIYIGCNRNYMSTAYYDVIVNKEMAFEVKTVLLPKTDTPMV